MSDEPREGVDLPVVAGESATQLHVVETRSGMFGTDDAGDTSGFGGLVDPVVLPAPATKPYGGWFDDVTDALTRFLPDFDDAIESVVVHRGELTLVVRRERLVEVAQALRDRPELRFEMCL